MSLPWRNVEERVRVNDRAITWSRTPLSLSLNDMQRVSINVFKRRLTATVAVDLYPSTAQHSPQEESQLNDSLRSLVLTGKFSAAERLRLNIVSNGFRITPRPEYARVALACIQNRRLSVAHGFKLGEYLTWLDLVADRETLRLSSSSPSSALLTSLKSPFGPIVHELTYRATVSKFRPFLTHTASSIASKGFAQHHLLTLARPLTLVAASPASPSVASLLKLEPLAVRYEQVHELPATPIAVYIRSCLIHLFVQRGWWWKSVDLVLEERRGGYGLPDHVYKAVLDAMMTMTAARGEGVVGSERKKKQVLRKWEEDKSR